MKTVGKVCDWLVLQVLLFLQEEEEESSPETQMKMRWNRNLGFRPRFFSVSHLFSSFSLSSLLSRWSPCDVVEQQAKQAFPPWSAGYCRCGLSKRRVKAIHSPQTWTLG